VTALHPIFNTTLRNNSYDNNPLTHTQDTVQTMYTVFLSRTPATEHVTSPRVNSPKMSTIRPPYDNSVNSRLDR